MENNIKTEIEIDYRQIIDRLRKKRRTPKQFDSAMQLALNIHAMIHTSNVSDSDQRTSFDTMLEGIEDDSVIPTSKDETIAWHLWHIARIEDWVSNLLIAEQTQVFNDEWMTLLNVTIRGTGNAMGDEEIIDFSQRVSKQALIHYRNTGGSQTRSIIRNLQVEDLKRKPKPEYLDRLVSEGGLLEDKKSIWLKDFWGKYTVSGLILLPLTLHQPDSIQIKELIKVLWRTNDDEN